MLTRIIVTIKITQSECERKIAKSDKAEKHASVHTARSPPVLPDLAHGLFNKPAISETLTELDNSKAMNTGYVDTDMLPGSYPHRKYMVCMV